MGVVITKYPGATIADTETSISLTGYINSKLTSYNENVDANEMGYCNGLIRRSHCGGRYSTTISCGTRASSNNSFTVRKEPVLATRGCRVNRHIILGLFGLNQIFICLDIVIMYPNLYITQL